MNRRYLAPPIQDYQQVIRSTARILEKHKTSWNLAELIMKIKQRYTVAGGSFENNIKKALESIMDDLEYIIGPREERYYSFGYAFIVEEEPDSKKYVGNGNREDLMFMGVM